MSRLDGKVAVITGGAGGIGRAVAEAIAAEGGKVVIGDTSAEAAEQVCHAIVGAGGSAIAVAVDVSDRSGVESLATAALSAFGTPSIVFCSAGVVTAGGPMDILQLSDEEWNRVIDVNLRGTFLTCQIMARLMVAARERGSIITVSSIGAERPMAGAPAYHTSKAAIVGLTRTVAVSLAPYGIRANAIAPGYIDTNITRFILDDNDRAKELNSRIPIGRIGLPIDLAGTVVYLASDESSYVTGEVIHVDGGAMVLGWTSATPPHSYTEDVQDKSG